MKYLSKLKKLADLYFETSSDIGGVAVGNEQFCMNLNNGYGDGTTKVFVFNTNRIPSGIKDFLVFNDCLGGKFNIYEEDISVYCKEKSKVLCTLKGYYGAYYPKNEMWWEDNEPVVVLEKWSDMGD